MVPGKVVDTQLSEVSESILRQAHAWNTQSDVTDVLCLGQEMFLRVPDGERGKLTKRCARIHAHPRLKDLELTRCASIAGRRDGDGSMAHVQQSDVDPQTRIDWPEFDPSSPSGLLIMARIDEPIAQGKPVQLP